MRKDLHVVSLMVLLVKRVVCVWGQTKLNRENSIADGDVREHISMPEY